MTLPRRALDVGLAGLAAAQLAAAVCLRPAPGGLTLPDGSPLPGLCLVHALFRVDCPFCGMTRSFVALAHGDLAASVGFHPAGPLLFAAMAALVALVATAAVRRSPPMVERRRFLIAFEGIVLVCLALGAWKMMRS
jgi:hypothetical protein